MADPVWIDGSTPLNSVNMTKLQTRDEKGAPSGYVGLDSGSNAFIAGVFASGYGGARQVTLSSSVIPSGYAGVAFGSAGDTNLYRAAANDLRTDGSFMAGTHVQSAGGGANRIMLNADGHIYFGGAADTNLYRNGANSLWTDSQFVSKNLVSSWNTTAGQIILGGGGTVAQILFGSAQDTNLYRVAASTLKTDGVLQVGTIIYANVSAITQVGVGAITPGTPAAGMFFGSAADTNLYRNGANSLRTNAQVWVDQAVYVNMALTADKQVFVGQLGGSPGQPGITLGGDANLYRYAATGLATDGYFRVGQNVIANQGSAAGQVYIGGAGGIYFGSAADTTLFRSAAGQLSSNAEMIFQGDVSARGTGGALSTRIGYFLGFPGIGFGPSLDTGLYRSAAGNLRTDGVFIVGGNGAGGQNALGYSNLQLSFYGDGGAPVRWVAVGAPDSAGPGYRMLMVQN